jgi:hypothetical protein
MPAVSRAWLTRYVMRANQPAVPDLMVRAALSGGDWRRECALRTVTDVAVFLVCGPGGETGVLKVATTESGMVGLRRERDVLSRLRSDEQLGEWRALLPAPLDGGDVGDGAFLLTGRLPGQDGRGLPLEAASRLTSAAIDAITPLQRRAQTVRMVDDAMLDQWVGEPAERVRAAVPCNGGTSRLVGILHSDLAGRRVTTGWTHGDFHPGNLLVGSDGRVTGIVDWGEAREEDLPVLDLAFWLLTVPTPGQPREFGARVAARLDGDRCWTPAESRLLDSFKDGDVVTGRTLLLLAWLRHVASNLAKSDRYANSALWWRRNVRPVLRLVAEGECTQAHRRMWR